MVTILLLLTFSFLCCMWLVRRPCSMVSMRSASMSGAACTRGPHSLVPCMPRARARARAHYVWAPGAVRRPVSMPSRLALTCTPRPPFFHTHTGGIIRWAHGSFRVVRPIVMTRVELFEFQRAMWHSRGRRTAPACRMTSNYWHVTCGVVYALVNSGNSS